MAFLSLPVLAVSLTAAFLAWRVHWEVTTGARQRAFKRQHGCLPPKQFPSKIPLGLDIFYRLFRAFREHRVLEFWRGALTDNDTQHLLFSLLGKEVHLTADPENIKAMLATNFNTWSIGKERIEQMSEFLGMGVFTTEGAAWKHSRNLLRPCFERSQVADFSMLDRHTRNLIKKIPSDGSTVDLQPLFQDLTLDIATEFLFGQSTNSLAAEQDEDVEKFVTSFEYCQNPLSRKKNDWGTIGTIIRAFLPDRKTMKKHVKIVQEFADKIIEQEISSRNATPAKPESSSRYVFLDELLTQTQDRIVLRSELLNILLAGRDTTAALLSNVFFSLSRHPDIVTRLRKEIAEHVGDGLPTYEQLKDMKYLKAILSESQRLYPIVPMNGRQALTDTTLPRGGGPTGTSPVFVAKGCQVAYHMYTMHRLPSLYGPSAESFIPSRWLDSETEAGVPLRPGWGYLPFSGGPRVCIGQQFALVEASYVIVRVLQEFGGLESRDSEPWREKMTIICSSLGGCKVALRK